MNVPLSQSTKGSRSVHMKDNAQESQAHSDSQRYKGDAPPTVFRMSSVRSEPTIGPSSEQGQLRLRACRKSFADSMNSNRTGREIASKEGGGCNGGLCVIAFQTYHALRNTYSCEINSPVLNSDFAHIAIISCDVLSLFSEATCIGLT